MTTLPGSTRKDTRPAPLWLRLIIFLFCSVQFLTMAFALLTEPEIFMGPLRAGYISPIGMVCTFLFPFLLMTGGTLLLLSRKSSLWFVMAYIPYQAYWVLSSATGFEKAGTIVSIIIVGAIVYYIVNLRSSGRLR